MRPSGASSKPRADSLALVPSTLGPDPCLLSTAMIPSELCPSLVTLGSTPPAYLPSLALADNFMAGKLAFLCSYLSQELELNSILSP